MANKLREESDTTKSNIQYKSLSMHGKIISFGHVLLAIPLIMIKYDANQTDLFLWRRLWRLSKQSHPGLLAKSKELFRNRTGNRAFP